MPLSEDYMNHMDRWWENDDEALNAKDWTSSIKLRLIPFRAFEMHTSLKDDSMYCNANGTFESNTRDMRVLFTSACYELVSNMQGLSENNQQYSSPRT